MTCYYDPEKVNNESYSTHNNYVDTGCICDFKDCYQEKNKNREYSVCKIKNNECDFCEDVNECDVNFSSSNSNNSKKFTCPPATICENRMFDKPICRKLAHFDCYTNFEKGRTLSRRDYDCYLSGNDCFCKKRSNYCNRYIKYDKCGFIRYSALGAGASSSSQNKNYHKHPNTRKKSRNPYDKCVDKLPSVLKSYKFGNCPKQYFLHLIEEDGEDRIYKECLCSHWGVDGVKKLNNYCDESCFEIYRIDGEKGGYVGVG